MAELEKKDWTRRTKVSLVATDAHPHLPEGHKFDIHPNHKDQLLERKWAVEPGGKTKVKDAAVPKTSDSELQAKHDELAAENEELKKKLAEKK